MKRDQWVYLSQLVRTLRDEGVDGAKIGEHVAEIDAHLTESGGDPVAEFGAPSDLARELAQRPGSRRNGWVPPLWAAYLLGAVLLAIVLPLITPGEWTPSTIPVTASAFAYATVFYLGVALIRWRTNHQLDGRSWRSLAGWQFFTGVAAVAVVVTSASTLWEGAVIYSAPKVPYLVFAAIAVPVIVWLLVRQSNPVRFPDHATHLRKLKWGPLAGSPPKRA